MGRHPIGDKAMSAAERQRLRRERLKKQGMVFELVNSDLCGEYFDIQARIARAFRDLLREGHVPEELARLVVNHAVEVISPKSRIDRLFFKKKITEFLNSEEE